MIQPKDGRPSLIGEHHGLARLTQALEAIEQGQHDQHLRDVQMQETLILLAQQLRRLTAEVEHLRLALGAFP